MSKLSEARRRIEVMGMAEAQEELKKQRRQLFDLRLQLARGEVKNNRQFPQIRADIARLMYHISELNREARREQARGGHVAEAEAALEEVEAEPEVPAPAREAKPARARGARRATVPVTPPVDTTPVVAAADEHADEAEAESEAEPEAESDAETMNEAGEEGEIEDATDDEDEDEDESGPEAK